VDKIIEKIIERIMHNNFTEAFIYFIFFIILAFFPAIINLFKSIFILIFKFFISICMRNKVYTNNQNIPLQYLLKSIDLSNRKYTFYPPGFYHFLLKSVKINLNLFFGIKSFSNDDSKILISSLISDYLFYKNKDYEEIFYQCVLIEIDDSELSYQLTSNEILEILNKKYDVSIMNFKKIESQMARSIILYYKNNTPNEFKHENTLKATKKFIHKIKKEMSPSTIVILLDSLADSDQENTFLIKTEDFIVKKEGINIINKLYFEQVNIENCEFLKNKNRYDHNLSILSDMNRCWEEKPFKPHISFKFVEIIFTKIIDKTINNSSEFKEYSTTPFNKHYQKIFKSINRLSFNLTILFIIIYTISLYFKGYLYKYTYIINYKIVEYIIITFPFLLLYLFFIKPVIKSNLIGYNSKEFSDIFNGEKKLFQIYFPFYTYLFPYAFSFLFCLTSIFFYFNSIIKLFSSKINNQKYSQVNNNDLIANHPFLTAFFIFLFFSATYCYRLFFISKRKSQLKKLKIELVDPIKIALESRSVLHLQLWISFDPNFFLGDLKNKETLVEKLQEWAFYNVNHSSFKWKRKDNSPYSGDIWGLLYEIENYCLKVSKKEPNLNPANLKTQLIPLLLKFLNKKTRLKSGFS
jgi:hypothetical protein